MKALPSGLFSLTLCLTVWLWMGCGRHEGDGHQHGKGAGHGATDEHGHEHGHGHDHDHGPGEAEASGASFEAGQGVRLAGETRKILGIELADVMERRLPNQIRLTVQVYGEKHHHRPNEEDHAGCDVQGSGFLATNIAASVRSGQLVQIVKGTNGPLAGVVLAVQKALALGEAEVVVGVSNATAALLPGEFVSARIVLPRDDVAPAVPAAAVLRTSGGSFVYAVNGDAFLRRGVKTGAEADGWVEITEGLRSGEQVVARGGQSLWLIELRATKGGGHSH